MCSLGNYNRTCSSTEREKFSIAKLKIVRILWDPQLVLIALQDGQILGLSPCFIAFDHRNVSLLGISNPKNAAYSPRKLI